MINVLRKACRSNRVQAGTQSTVQTEKRAKRETREIDSRIPLRGSLPESRPSILQAEKRVRRAQTAAQMKRLSQVCANRTVVQLTINDINRWRLIK